MSPRLRHAVTAVIAVIAVALGAGGCAPAGPSPAQSWNGGRLYVATGNTTGVFYMLGGGYADLVTKYLPGYEARAEPTSGSVDNIKRVDTGDMQLGLTLADAAADAVAGRGSFDGRPQRITALARVYTNYTHVLVRTSARITEFGDLRGKRVSTGSPGSGTEMMAERMLTAADIDPDKDVVRSKLSLAETTAAMKGGAIDALFWSGGLPTPGIADLMAAAPGQFAFLSLRGLLEPLNARYGKSYGLAPLPRTVYNTPTDIVTLVTPNLLIATPDLPEQLAYDLTRLLFQHQPELAAAHPEGKNFDLKIGRETGVVSLHPGARRFFATG